MALVIFDNTNTARDVLEVQDLAAAKFACIAGVVEPIVSRDGTLTGTGSSTNPLSVNPWIVAGDVGTNQTITPGDTLSLVGVGVMLTTGVAGDIVNIEIAPGVNGDVLTTVAGVPTWQAPAAAAAWTLAGDAGVNQTISPGDTATFVGVGVMLTTGVVGDILNIEIAPGVNGDVLTTVGGVPVWAAPATDALVDTGVNYASGAAIMQHTAVDGTVTQFAQGFRSVQASVTCLGTGVSVTKMVRAVSIIAGEILVIDAANEHSSLQTGASVATALGINISPLGVYNSGTLGPLNVNNPSACRALANLAVCDYGAQFVFTTLGVWRWEGLLSINAGPFVATATQQFGTVPGLIGLPGVMIGADNFNIPAAGTRAFLLQNRVTTLVAGAAGALWQSHTAALRTIGSTV